MPGTVQDLLVHTQDGFENLPADGKFEVVDGRAILFPPTDVEHDCLSDDPVDAFRVALKAVGYGFVVSTPNVFIPRPAGALGKFQSRVADIGVSKHCPKRH